MHGSDCESIYRDFCASFPDLTVSKAALKGKLQPLGWSDEQWEAHRQQASNWESETRAGPVKGDARRKDKREAMREQVMNGPPSRRSP